MRARGRRVTYRRRMRLGDAGAGAITVLGIVSAALSLALITAPLVAVFPVAHRAAGAADAAALAAADSLSGAHSGTPCEVADRVAAANRTKLDACVVDGLVVTVRVVASAGLARVSGVATAGPPVLP